MSLSLVHAASMCHIKAACMVEWSRLITGKHRNLVMSLDNRRSYNGKLNIYLIIMSSTFSIILLSNQYFKILIMHVTIPPMAQTAIFQSFMHYNIILYSILILYFMHYNIIILYSLHYNIIILYLLQLCITFLKQNQRIDTKSGKWNVYCLYL